jgi:thiol:disulfide interchange protein DsbA
MRRLLCLTTLLVLCASCARHATPAEAAPPATPAPPAVNAPAATPPPAAEPPAPGPPQSAVEQAKGAQESPDGAVNEKPESGDTSLERMSTLPADAQLPAGPWKAGVNYDPVVPGQPTSVEPGKVEVLEFMWLGCPHCYALQPVIRAWLRNKPAYIDFAFVPVMWDAPHAAHAKLLYTLEALGRSDLIDKAFDTIHGSNPLIASTDAETLRIEAAWAVQQGVSAADFANAYNSQAVSANLQRAQDLMLRYRVQSVPEVAINGKYLTDVSKAGGPDKLIRLIDDLAASEHRH